MAARKINRDVPRHACPICFHTCQSPRPVTNGKIKIGRPPVQITAFGNWLARHTSEQFPMKTHEIAERYPLSLFSVHTYITRARDKGYDIQLDRREGYWVASKPRNSGAAISES